MLVVRRGRHLNEIAPNKVWEANLSAQRQSVIEQFIETRQDSLKLVEPLVHDDFNLQAAYFTSPPKWHLAHTTWFFETFILKKYLVGYQSQNDKYEVLFNSYYNGIGEQYPRAKRGLLSRPTVTEVLGYRTSVDEHLLALLDSDGGQDSTLLDLVRLGVQHEKQHQELLLTDLKYSLFQNPLYPVYENQERVCETGSGDEWQHFDAQLVTIGVNPEELEFSFDNETPRHKVHLESFSIAKTLVTNAEYAAFMLDGGYQRPELWLADGWAYVQENKLKAPLYWMDSNIESEVFTLKGVQELNPDAPVSHVSAYEADAYANWVGARLPTEFEWEHAALHGTLAQLYSECWQWTRSAYLPYPGFKIQPGAVGEYNGKFMSSQWVLRGGSCVSPNQHLRPSYRNFFYPHERWQFTGIRLAK